MAAADTPGAWPAPDRIGPYRILEQLGEGGMGIVYLAEQERPLRRRVAVKIIKLGMDTREVVARFEAERQALALMDHPNIATVFDAGATEDGRPYFVMEYVPGVPITEYCDSHRLSTRARLGLFTEVCAAVQHAHQKGVIHRDIKPSNVLVQVQDDKAVPKVIDFGIAKATDQRGAEATAFTQHGVFVGTPEYMSPEQAGAAQGDVDTRSDIYSLGVLLYELLVGTVPFESARLRRAAYGELQRIIREEEPARPSTKLSTLGATAGEVAERRHTSVPSLSRELRGDLDWITLKALEKDRTRRYASASELAADIARHLRDDPVVARPPSATYRTQKFVRRHKGPVAAAVALLAMLAAGLAVSTALYFSAERARQDADRQRVAAQESGRVAVTERDRAERAAGEEAVARTREAEQRQRAQDAQRVAVEQKGAAESALDKAETHLYFNNLDLADREWQANNVARAEQLLDDAPMRLRNWEWNYLKRLCHMESAVLRGHKGAVNDVAFAGDRLLSAGDDGSIRVWDARTHQAVATLPAHTGRIIALAASLDGQVLASLSAPPAGSTVSTFPGQESLHDVHVWTPGNAKRVLSLPRFDARAIAFFYTAIAVSPDGQRVVAGVMSGGAPAKFEIRAWDVALGTELPKVGDSASRISALTFSPDGSRLAVGHVPVTGPEAVSSRGIEVTIHDTETGESRLTLFGHTGDVTTVRFSPDGRSLITGTQDRYLRRWNAVDGKEIWSVQVNRGLNRVALSPNGARVAVATEDQSLRVFDATTGEERERLHGHTGSIESVAFSPDGTYLVSASGDGTLKVWPAIDASKPTALNGDLGLSSAFRISPDREWIASNRTGSTVQIWSTATGDLIPTVVARASTLAFSADSRRLAIGVLTRPSVIKILEVPSGRQVLAFPPVAGGVTRLVFSPRGNRLASLSPQVEIPAPGSALSVTGYGATIWDVRQARAIATLDLQGASGAGVQFAPDGERFAVASISLTQPVRRTVILASATTARVASALTGATMPVEFSKDGRMLATGTSDGSVTIWDPQSGDRIVSMPAHDSVVRSIAFSPDNSRLVSLTDSGTVTIWDVRTGHQLLSLRESSGPYQAREFTANGSLSAGNHSVAFTSDGRKIVVTTAARQARTIQAQIKTWDATPRPVP